MLSVQKALYQSFTEQHSLIPTRHILKLGQDRVGARGTPLASLFDVKIKRLFVNPCAGCDCRAVQDYI